MKTNTRIFLIGFMGSGKSTLGQQIAEGLDYRFVDTDAWIEEQEKRTISQIFEESGEEYFRKREQDALQAIIQLERCVIATGGGLPCYFDNMDVMVEQGWSIFLEMKAKDIIERLKGETANRPLLSKRKEVELLEWMEHKLLERNIFYQRATHTVDGDLSIPALTTTIINLWHEGA